LSTSPIVGYAEYALSNYSKAEAQTTTPAQEKLYSYLDSFSLTFYCSTLSLLGKSKQDSRCDYRNLALQPKSQPAGATTTISISNGRRPEKVRI
jgi:hypothetical protein